MVDWYVMGEAAGVVCTGTTYCLSAAYRHLQHNLVTKTPKSFMSEETFADQWDGKNGLSSALPPEGDSFYYKRWVWHTEENRNIHVW